VAPGLKGDQIPSVHELNASFVAQYNYDLPIAGWTGAVRFEGSYTDDSFTQLRPTAGNNRYQASYELFNTRFAFHNDEQDLHVAVFIENMFDERADLFIGGGSGGQPTNKITSRPRTVGVQLTKGFGR
jgi:hypothetical protein